MLEKLFEFLGNTKVYDLSKEFFTGMPRRLSAPPFSFSLLRRHLDSNSLHTSSAACIFSMGGHTGTHIDALGHVAVNGKVYGHDEPIAQNESYGEGIKFAGIDEIGPIVRRGVLFDIPRLRGVEMLGSNDVIEAEDLIKASEQQGVKLQAGDVALIRTGWILNWDREPKKYNAPDEKVPGVGNSAAQWLVEQGISLTGSDTTAYEKVDVTKLEVHRLLMTKFGIPIMETMNLEELAQEGAWEFVFIALPLKIIGGTGSPIRPIAIC